MRTVVFFDADNTLLDNDAAKRALDLALRRSLGRPATDELWRIYEEVRAIRGVVDYPETIVRFGRRRPRLAARAARLVLEHPYERFVLPGALAALRAGQRAGAAVILSDGDASYQPLKLARTGLVAAVAGNAVVFDHKERHVAELRARFPARRYVAVDDRRAVLGRLKRRFAGLLTTIHVRQGHYGNEAGPAADLELHGILAVPRALRTLLARGGR